MKDIRRIDQEDIEFILAHINEPDKLTDADFLIWLQEDDHLALFEEVRNHREAFLRWSDSLQVNTKEEYRRFSEKTKPGHQKLYFWLSSAACVVLLLTTTFVIRQKSIMESPEQLAIQDVSVGKKSAELILASGEHVNLEKNAVQLRESTGTLITNDAVQQLTYRSDSVVRPATSASLVYNTLKIPAGADYVVQLADGTKVRLNCETTLRFPVEFSSNERKVYLDGEAYFEVRKAKEWPFVVVTDSMCVRVTGTSFNVKAYREENIVHATLVTGSVVVASGENMGGGIRLRPSQQFVLDKRTYKAEVKDVDIYLYTGWIDGMFVFRNNRLEDVMEMLAKWYRIDVFYTSGSVKDMRFSANLDRYEHIDRLLEIIRATDKLKIERKGNTVTIGWK